MAASKIESHYKALIEYRMVRAYRALMVAAAIRAQAGVRGYLARSYYEWMVINGIAATKIQRLWRGFLARRVFHLLRITFLARTHITPAVLWMQQMSRRFLVRSVYVRTLANHVHTSVVIPASMLLQRTWWGHLAKKVEWGVRGVTTPNRGRASSVTGVPSRLTTSSEYPHWRHPGPVLVH